MGDTKFDIGDRVELTGADWKVLREEDGIDLPEVVTITGISYTGSPSFLHRREEFYIFSEDVMGEEADFTATLIQKVPEDLTDAEKAYLSDPDLVSALDRAVVDFDQADSRPARRRDLEAGALAVGDPVVIEAHREVQEHPERYSPADDLP